MKEKGKCVVTESRKLEAHSFLEIRTLERSLLFNVVRRISVMTVLTKARKSQTSTVRSV